MYHTFQITWDITAAVLPAIIYQLATLIVTGAVNGTSSIPSACTRNCTVLSHPALLKSLPHGGHALTRWQAPATFQGRVPNRERMGPS